MSTVQLFRREDLNFARFDDINARHRDANIDSTIRSYKSLIGSRLNR
jgi:hypothetical protein